MTPDITNQIRIGEWVFSPETGTLESGDSKQRLENRASALLEFMCNRSGQVLSHSDIIDIVWDGRFVSPNSVAVVISDIRRALGDEVRQPRFIETVPKRGYRMIAPVTSLVAPEANSPENKDPSIAATRRYRKILSVLLGVFVFMGLLWTLWGASSPPVETFKVAVAPIVNETEDASYAALTTAVSELLSVELSRHENLVLRPEADATLIVSGTLILWDGHPAVALYATSATTTNVVWSGMARGPETQLPRQIRTQVSNLAKAGSDYSLQGLNSEP